MRVGVSQRGATTFNRDPFLTLNCNFDTDEDNSASSSIIVTRPPKGFEEREEKEDRFGKPREYRMQHPREKAEETKFKVDQHFHTSEWVKDVTINVLRSNKTWGSYKHLKLSQSEARPVLTAQLVRQLVCANLSTLYWVENNRSVESYHEDLVNDVYSSLNFEDVLLTTGKIIFTQTLLKGWLDQYFPIGMEYVGLDANKQCVMGIRETKTRGKKEAMENGDGYAAVYKPDEEREINNAIEGRETEHRVPYALANSPRFRGRPGRVKYTICCSIGRNDDVYSYVVGVGSIMGYWVTFDQVLRGIPKGGIVSQEEVEIHLRLENFSA
ncbi:Fatty acid synthase [Acromyrmex echinatior]|uniref:Fatty acid synthase n=1 Tax=Acromyrmex echinatior TaxID=103372 RepID=F4WW30_ACREC|nr:Fatty acid synthase [Acromyrmex echinatior]